MSMAAPSWRSRTIACSRWQPRGCRGPGVTVSFACEFLDAAREGERVEGTRLAQVFGRTSHLNQQFVEHYPGLGGAPHQIEQQSVAHPRLRAGEVGCDRMKLL